MEIGWDDDLHDESGKDIFEMDLEGVEQDGDEVQSVNFLLGTVPYFPVSISNRFLG